MDICTSSVYLYNSFALKRPCSIWHRSHLQSTG